MHLNVAGSKLLPQFAGYRGVTEKLSAYIAWPWQFREECEALGVQWPGGVLLTGPPGVGKTTLVQRVVAEVGGKLLYVNAADVVGSQLGETERRLRGTFQTAHHAAQFQTAIIFIDEVDALCPHRSRANSYESRVVAQLLTLMDGVSTTNSSVAIIAATNRIEAVDAALRRPGRFDMEIHLPLPDETIRLQIFHEYTSGLKLCEHVDLARLASTCHGYTGADIKALCRESFMIAVGSLIDKDVNAHAHQLDIPLSDSHFAQAMYAIGPAIARGMITDDGANSIPAALGGYEEVKTSLYRAFTWHVQHPCLFSRLGLKCCKGVLLHGPPGCGKTSLAAFAATLGHGSNVKLSASMLFSMHMGEGEKFLQHAFHRARSASPSVIIIDDIDVVFGARSQNSDSVSSGSLLSVLLMEMDGLCATSGVTMVATSSHPWNIDSALLRPGRLEQTIHVPAPDLASRVEVLKVHTNVMHLSSDVDLGYVAEATENFTCAELQTLCREAAEIAQKRHANIGFMQLKMQDLMLGLGLMTCTSKSAVDEQPYMAFQGRYQGTTLKIGLKS